MTIASYTNSQTSVKRVPIYLRICSIIAGIDTLLLFCFLFSQNFLDKILHNSL